jgi:hypothetical protein
MAGAEVNPPPSESHCAITGGMLLGSPTAAVSRRASIRSADWTTFAVTSMASPFAPRDHQVFHQGDQWHGCVQPNVITVTNRAFSQRSRLSPAAEEKLKSAGIFAPALESLPSEHPCREETELLMTNVPASRRVAMVALLLGIGLEPVSADQPGRQAITIPGTGYEVALDAAETTPGARLAPPLLDAIEAWLASEFDLPKAGHHPRIEIVPPAKIVDVRYQGLPHNAATEGAPNGELAAALMRDTVAVYSDADETIYLVRGWAGRTAADLSVLVHEMVHHAQKRAGLKYECPQEREKLAYAAQDRWLGLFGRSLEQDFELDPFSLLPKTRCLY